VKAWKTGNRFSHYTEIVCWYLAPFQMAIEMLNHLTQDLWTLNLKMKQTKQFV